MVCRLLFASLLALATLPSAFALSRPAKRDYATHYYYVLEHDPAAGVSVESCAGALGLEVVEPAGELQDHWLLRTPKSALSPVDGDTVLDTLRRLDTSHWSPIYGRSAEDRAVRAVKHLSRQSPRQRVKRAAVPVARAPPLPGSAEKYTLARDIAERLGIDDPLFSDQWHLINEDFPEHMVNAAPVWDMGITGEGVISAMVDDGLDFESDDLADNFDPTGSYDFNLHVDLPKPMLWDDHHGTRCAGQIAAVKNGVCGVGIAYGSKVAGVRILSGPITDVDEAAALNYGYQNTSIYSCSWGPPDDGQAMDAPGYLIKKAIVNGVQNGRDGKGSVFVFAAGNGAHGGDQCNFDGYTNSIYSVTVASIDYEGKHPYYSEACAANMVVTYSSGSNTAKQIVTTDVGKDKCTKGHGGTSAAAPNAVGIFALALSTRPDLTWRDVQHLCVQTAQMVNSDDPDWERTATGRPFSYKFGFGKLDAYEYVTAAKDWQLVKPQGWVEMPAIQLADGAMDKNGTFSGGEEIVEGGVSSSMTVTKQMLDDNNFETLEHVTVRVWIQHTRRGDVEVEIISPNGIRSVLAGKRYRDADADGFQGWKFMSVKHWGENPLGEWTIRVSDQNNDNESGRFIGWSMSLWGSVIDAEKATPYVLLSTDEEPFPPPEPTHSIPPLEPTGASTTTSYLKPTISGSPTTTLAAPTKPPVEGQEDIVSTATSEGSEHSTAISSQDDDDAAYESNQFIMSVVGIVSFLILLGGLAFLTIRHVRKERAHYSKVSDSEDVRMASIDASRASISRDGGAEVLFDADAERRGLLSNPVAFHSGFLDDEEEASASSRPVPLYRDAPEEPEGNDRICPPQ